jgi:hypothetical protein
MPSLAFSVRRIDKHPTSCVSWFGGPLAHDRAVPSSGRDFGCDALRMQRGAHGFVALLRLAE